MNLDDGRETVYTRTARASSKHCYHLTPDCPFLKRATDNPAPRDRAEAERWGLEPCDECTGAKYRRSTGNDLHDKLLKIGQENYPEKSEP